MRSPPQRHLSREHWPETSDRFQQLGPPRTDESRQSDHFARAHGKFHLGATGLVDDALQLQNLSGDIAGHRRNARAGDAAADHPRDQIVFRQTLKRRGGNMPTIAQHRHGIAQCEDFVQSMRHVDHRPPLGLQPPENGKQPFRLGLAQRAGRLVEHENPCIKPQRGRDL